MTVAFATCSTIRDINPDDRLAAAVLQTRGVDVAPVVWDDASIDWAGFSCVVIRSTWDYHLASDRFTEWLTRCAADAVNLWNRPGTVVPNMHKRYLVDLARAGIRVVPTEIVDPSRGETLAGLLERRGWAAAVVKPAISASAYRTWPTSRATAERDQDAFASETRTHDLLVQVRIDEVATQGEWSLVFFAGEYSHAVLKRPAAGDFRVQQELGGTATPATPPAHILQAGRHILSRWPEPLLYARVDGVEVAGEFMLMEVELIEPFLFIGSSACGAERFADAIRGVCR